MEYDLNRLIYYQVSSNASPLSHYKHQTSGEMYDNTESTPKIFIHDSLLGAYIVKTLGYLHQL